MLSVCLLTPLSFCVEIVSACAKLAILDGTAVKVVGTVALVFYTVVPLFALRACSSSTKEIVQQNARQKEDSSYQEELADFNKKALASKINEVTAQSDCYEQRLSRESPGYQASVINILLMPFEEAYWWWKTFLMLEKALLAAVILLDVSSFWATGEIK